ncbi:MAG TPA: aldehyde dehydrogenase family protein [Thermosynechococcaceae cyanobacterium]
MQWQRPTFGNVMNSIAPTSQDQADAAIARLVSRKEAWIAVSVGDRIAYLKRCIAEVMAVAESWVATACHAKGIPSDSQLVGEEWLVGPVATVANLRQLIQTLEANGQPAPIALRSGATGQFVAEVFPKTVVDRLLWLGYRGEVWIEPGQPATQGMIYRQPPDRGQVALVLGAGNIASIAPMDTLNKLFAEDQVVLLKMNPVNDYLGKFLEQGLRSLVQAGFLEIVYGGAEIGAYLCQHPQIDTVHITGSHQTHDAIVWGSTAAEQAERKANQQPKLNKPITSELGCVTPILVVPGRWSRSDLAFQARQVASAVAHNASFNCAAAKVLVTAQGWEQREEFLQQVRQALASIPPRQAYYPRAQQRYQAFLDRYPQSEPLASRTAAIVPWTVIPNVPPAAGEYALTTEAFCGVLAEVSLDATSAEEFLAEAVTVANEKIWGTLSCTVLIDRTTQRRCWAELEQAIADLRYGSIGVNVWSAVIYSVAVFPWGAFPGHSLDNIGSGRGMVHNSDLFEHPQKSVLYAPFRLRPTPLWFADHRNLARSAQAFAHLQAAPGWGNFWQVFVAALKG